ALQLLAGLGVPYSDRLVRAARDDAAPIGGKRGRKDLSLVTREALQFLAAGHVPEPDRLVLAGGAGLCAVRGGGHGPDVGRGPHKVADFLVLCYLPPLGRFTSPGQAPQAHQPVLAGGKRVTAVSRKDRPRDWQRDPSQAEILPRLQVPKPDAC